MTEKSERAPIEEVWLSLSQLDKHILIFIHLHPTEGIFTYNIKSLLLEQFQQLSLKFSPEEIDASLESLKNQGILEVTPLEEGEVIAITTHYWNFIKNNRF